MAEAQQKRIYLGRGWSSLEDVEKGTSQTYSDAWTAIVAGSPEEAKEKLKKHLNLGFSRHSVDEMPKELTAMQEHYSLEGRLAILGECINIVR